ncbi:hypothetical protein [Mycolicibacterium porcinum]|uniref:hypothetical protein n=1 Tax=Mycolicibacterium porcinum TaxID=39693 RepID=UPI0010424321|nr:hypothetical protein [Mycolicibacterium porcinum]
MPTASSKLRTEVDAALRREAERLGVPTLTWTAKELHHIEAACRAADHRAELQRVLAVELARPEDEIRVASITRLSTEIRLLDVGVGEHLGKLGIAELKPDHAQQRAASQARWGAVKRPKRLAT